MSRLLGSGLLLLRLGQSHRIPPHRFFVAAMMAFLPADESFRLDLGAASGTGPSATFLEAAHLLR